MEAEPHKEIKTVAIRMFGNHESAELAAANLEAHSIECWLNADDCGGMYPNLTAAGGVRLLVRASDAEAAIALLNTQVSPAEINQIETEAVVSAPLESVPVKKLAWGQILFGIVMGIILCLLYQWNSKLGTKTHYHYTHGRADQAWIYRNRRLVEFLGDRNLDGVWDEWIHYNSYGQMTAYEVDNNFDGKPDEFWTYSHGFPVELRKDTDFNGTPDMICIYKYGILQQLDIMPNGAKFTTRREIFRNGVLTEIWRGGNSAGHFSEVVRYDPFLNPVSTNVVDLLPVNLP